MYKLISNVPFCGPQLYMKIYKSNTWGLKFSDKCSHATQRNLSIH